MLYDYSNEHHRNILYYSGQDVQETLTRVLEGVRITEKLRELSKLGVTSIAINISEKHNTLIENIVPDNMAILAENMLQQYNLSSLKPYVQPVDNIMHMNIDIIVPLLESTYYNFLERVSKI